MESSLFSSLQLLRLDKFLVEYWLGQTPGELSKIWNKANTKHKTNSVFVVQRLNKLKIKISTDEIQNIHNLRILEERLSNKEYCSSKDFVEKIKSERMKLMMSRIENKRDLWSGLETEESKLFTCWKES